MLARSFAFALTVSAVALGIAHAQDRGTMDRRVLPPLADPGNPNLPAKQVFGRESEPAAMAPHVYGFYAKGCLAGGRPLPQDGPDWQVMRPSRNRFYGHPVLIHFVERLADRVRQTTNWPGILIGDMSQPRGGPMLGGHASHQIGLDVDVWLRPMPDRRFSPEEREFTDSLMVVRDDRRDVDPRLFTRDTMDVIKAAADDPQVQRIFVNAAIKKAICREARGDRSWLDKGPADVRTRLSFPYPPRLSAQRGRLPASGGSAGRGWLRCIAATLVLGLDPPPAPRQQAAVPAAAAHHGLHARGLPRRRGGTGPTIRRAVGPSRA